MIRRTRLVPLSLFVLLLACSSLCAPAMENASAAAPGQPQRLDDSTLKLIEKCLQVRSLASSVYGMEGSQNIMGDLDSVDNAVQSVCNPILVRNWAAYQDQLRRQVQARCDELTLTLAYLIMTAGLDQAGGISRIHDLDSRSVYDRCRKAGWTWDGFRARNPGVLPDESPRRQTRPAPAPEPVPARPWSGVARGTCHTTYEGYSNSKGQYIGPGKPQDQNAQISFSWDDKDRLYVVRIGSQVIVGSGPTFSFSDNCDQNAKSYEQPGCVYKSRSDFTLHGDISTQGDTITYHAFARELYWQFDTSHSEAVCTFRKEHP